MRDFNVLVFSNGTPKDPLGRRSGQGDKQTLNSPNRPHPAPKPWPPAYSHQLYLLRLPRSPLMQGWEGSEESGSAVQGRVVGRSDTWPNSETPHAQHGWSLLAQIQMAPSTAPSSHLPSPPGSSLGFFFPTAPEQVSPKSPKKEKKKKNKTLYLEPHQDDACLTPPHPEWGWGDQGRRTESEPSPHPHGHGYTLQPNLLQRSKADSLPQDTVVEAMSICKISHVPQLFQENLQTEVIVSLLSLATHIMSGLWHSSAPPSPSLPPNSTTKNPNNFKNIFILKCSLPFKKIIFKRRDFFPFQSHNKENVSPAFFWQTNYWIKEKMPLSSQVSKCQEWFKEISPFIFQTCTKCH